MQTDSPSSSTSTEDKKKKTLLILVLEDDPHLNRIIVHKLTGRGYNPILATNAQEAIDILERGEPVDILWLDIRLPGMSGLEFLKYVKEQEKFSHIKAFIVSASGNVEDQEKALRLGAAAYIVKGNHDLDEIIEQIIAE